MLADFLIICRSNSRLYTVEKFVYLGTLQTSGPVNLYNYLDLLYFLASSPSTSFSDQSYPTEQLQTCKRKFIIKNRNDGWCSVIDDLFLNIGSEKVTNK